MKDTCGLRIRKMRIKNKLSQLRLGKAVGLTQARIAAYERSSEEPPHKRLVVIAKVLDTTIEYLKEGKEVVTEKLVERIGDRLKIAMDQANTTVPILSEMTGISVEILNAYLNHQKGMAITDVTTLSTVLGVNKIWLGFGRE